MISHHLCMGDLAKTSGRVKLPSVTVRASLASELPSTASHVGKCWCAHRCLMAVAACSARAGPYCSPWTRRGVHRSARRGGPTPACTSAATVRTAHSSPRASGTPQMWRYWHTAACGRPPSSDDHVRAHRKRTRVGSALLTVHGGPVQPLHNTRPAWAVGARHRPLYRRHVPRAAVVRGAPPSQRAAAADG